MEGILMPQHQIWKMLQCAHILNLSIHFHTGNVYCDAVMTVHVSIFLIKKMQKSDSTLRALLPPQFKKCLHVTRLCVVVNVASLQKAYILHCYHGVIGI